ncbi:TPA: hypothetical protein DEP94_02370 [Candidatus Nomurabacteria bacterium]|nr:hypothetical protein [Candidatus Nomurabacteria bacterium]
MESQIKQIQEDLEIIKNRNKKVEQNKAWETSFFRKISIIVITYIVASLVMYFIGVPNFLLNALIPTIGFFLSTLSFSFLKNWWIEKFAK